MQFLRILFTLAFTIISPIRLTTAAIDILDDYIPNYIDTDLDGPCQPAFFDLDASLAKHQPVPHPTKPLYHSGLCWMHMVHTKRSASLSQNKDYQQFTVDLYDNYHEPLLANKTVHWRGTKHAHTTCRLPNPVPRGEVAGDPNKTFEWVYDKNLDELDFSYGDEHWKVEDEGNGRRIEQGKPPKKDTILWPEGGRQLLMERCSVQKWQDLGVKPRVHRFIDCYFHC